MQVLITSTDGFPDVIFTCTADSCVKEAAQAAADEWETNSELLNILYDGDVLLFNNRLLSHGLDFESQLVASQIRVFSKELLVKRETRAAVMSHCSHSIDKTLCVDTPTFVEDGFVEFDSLWLSEDVLKLSFYSCCKDATSISESFLHKSSVEQLDFRGLKNISSIGISFLYECKQLTSIDLSAFNNTTSVGMGFCNNCENLTELDLSSFRNVTSVGDYFLYGCSSLSEIVLSSFSNILCINKCFLYGCKSLTKADFSGLTRVKSIGDSFLCECSQLTSLNLDGFHSVETIGDYFLFKCVSLTELNLSCLKSVVTIGNFFLCFNKVDSCSEKKKKFLSRVLKRKQRRLASRD